MSSTVLMTHVLGVKTISPLGAQGQYWDDPLDGRQDVVKSSIPEALDQATRCIY